MSANGWTDGQINFSELFDSLKYSKNINGLANTNKIQTALLRREEIVSCSGSSEKYLLFGKLIIVMVKRG